MFTMRPYHELSIEDASAIEKEPLPNRVVCECGYVFKWYRLPSRGETTLIRQFDEVYEQHVSQYRANLNNMPLWLAPPAPIVEKITVESFDDGSLAISGVDHVWLFQKVGGGAINQLINPSKIGVGLDKLYLSSGNEVPLHQITNLNWDKTVDDRLNIIIDQDTLL